MARLNVDHARVWAWLALVLGVAASLGANLGHAFIPPADAGPGWSPSGWALFLTSVPPVLLFFAIKLVTVIRWPSGFWYAAARFGGLLTVAALMGYVSWSHISSLAAAMGETDRVVLILLPVGIDAFMLIAVAVLMATNATREHARPTAAPSSFAETGRLFPTGTGNGVYASSGRR